MNKKRLIISDDILLEKIREYSEINNKKDIVLYGQEINNLDNIVKDIVKKYYFLKENKDVKFLNKKTLALIVYTVIVRLIKENKLNFIKQRMVDYSLASEIADNIEMLFRNNKEDSVDNLKEKYKDKFEDITLILEEVKTVINKKNYLTISDIYKKAEVIAQDIFYNPFKNCDVDIRIKNLNPLQKSFLNSTNLTPQENKTEKHNESEIVDKINKNNIEFVSSLGLYNEIKYIIADIVDNKYNFDDCQICILNKDKIVPFLSYLKSCEIPFVYNGKISSEFTQDYCLLSKIFDLNYKYITQDKLKEFNQTEEKRLYFDYLLNLKELDEISFKDFFNNTYKFIKDDEIKDYLKDLIEVLDVCDFKTDVKSAQNLILDIIKEAQINYINEKADENNGYLTITTFSNLGNCVKSKLYITSLEGDIFPKEKSSSPILNDSQRIEIGIDNHFELKEKQSEIDTERFYQFLEYYSALVNKKLTLSYCSYNSVTDKEVSPSSIYLKFKNLCGKEEHYVDYSNISIFNKNNISLSSSLELSKEKGIEYLSATDVDLFTTCQMKLYFKKILSIPDESEQEEDYTLWLSPLDKGNFIHSILEEYVNKVFLNEERNSFNNKKINIIKADRIDEDLFNEIFERKDKEMFLNNPVSETVHNQEKEYYKNIIKKELKNIYDNLKEEIYPVAVEYEINNTIIENFNFKKCKIDRIDFNSSNNTYEIVDYKTNSKGGIEKLNNKRSKDKDILSQDYVYFVALEKQLLNININNKVSKTHFRFLTLGTSLDTNINENSYENLKNTLLNIKECEKTGIWQKNTQNNNCKYCSYRKICPKNTKEISQDLNEDEE